MPKKSAEALATVRAPQVQIWPAAPESCTKRQAELWKSLVCSRPADFWDPCAKLLLHQLVVHAEGFELISLEIERERTSGDPDDQRVQKLMAARGLESKSTAAIATKLRLAHSSQMSPERSRRAALDGAHAAMAKPWNE